MSADNLGPAVTDAFPSAVGLQDLMTPGQKAAPAPAPAPAPVPEVPAVEFSPGLFLNALKLADKLASRALGVDREEPETVEEVAGAIAPLVQYYAKGHSTVAALWGNLILALVGVGYSKAEKIQARKRATAEPEPEPPPMTPAEEEESNESGKGSKR